MAGFRKRGISILEYTIMTLWSGEVNPHTSYPCAFSPQMTCETKYMKLTPAIHLHRQRVQRNTCPISSRRYHFRHGAISSLEIE